MNHIPAPIPSSCNSSGRNRAGRHRRDARSGPPSAACAVVALVLGATPVSAAENAANLYEVADSTDGTFAFEEIGRPLNTGVAIEFAAAHIAVAEAQPPGVFWSRIYPTVSPPPRTAPALAFDTVRQRTILFGGSRAGTVLSDTWEREAGNWEQRPSVTFPPGRDGHAMVFDSARGRTVLFGGWSQGALQDTWEWDGSQWTQRQPSSQPPGVYYHAFAFDSWRGRAVLFGGYGGGYRSATWEWDGNNWIDRTGGNSPSARAGVAAAYDSIRRRVVLFGGRAGTTLFGDTWEWDGTVWTQQAPATVPPGREQHAMAFDAIRGRVVMFGGNSSNVMLYDTWEWDGVDWVANQLTAAPAGRHYHAMSFDSVRNCVALFGGHVAGTMVEFDDTWEYRHTDPASFTSFGTGCAGSLGVPTLTLGPGERPWLGDTIRFRLDNVPFFSAPFLVFGAARTVINLGFLGRSDCDLLVTPDLVVQLANVAGVATLQVRVPVSTALVGTTLHVQGGFLLPTDVAMSNGGTLLFQARL